MYDLELDLINRGYKERQKRIYVKGNDVVILSYDYSKIDFHFTENETNKHKGRTTFEHFKEKWTIKDSSRTEITVAILRYEKRFNETNDNYYKERLDYLLKLKQDRIAYERRLKRDKEK